MNVGKCQEIYSFLLFSKEIFAKNLANFAKILGLFWLHN